MKSKDLDNLPLLKDLREKLGRAGREFVKEKFAPDTMVGSIEEVYRKLLGGEYHGSR